MKMVVNIVNLIREGNTARRHREIGCRLWWYSLTFCHQMAECGKMFAAFFCAIKEILLFRQTQNLGQEFQRELQDMGFICSADVLADLTSHLNVLNLKLQAKGRIYISSSRSHWRIPQKLKLFEDALQKNDTTHFPSCQE
jgi:hypothetical protein